MKEFQMKYFLQKLKCINFGKVENCQRTFKNGITCNLPGF